MFLTDGERLGPYEVIAPIGAGGMAEVYRARDVRLGRPVAIKVLAPAIQTDEQQLIRFRQEAVAACALNHPNIVTIYDVGEAGAVTYIAMELVEGRPLRGMIAEGGLQIPVVVQLGIQLADGLAAAHDIGMVHRDLKPENVMVTADGRAKILDFGIAKMRPETGADNDTTFAAAALTQAGAVLGTVPYMAPEQARGGRVDARTDQFALGIVLYEMATGHHPFRRPTLVQTVSAILGEVPEPPEKINRAVPPALSWVIARCLAKQPGDRYASTRQLVADLRRLDTHPAVATTATAPTPRPRSRKAIDAIAVLPFTNESGAPDSDYLADGLTEMTINALSHVPKLRVMARSTVFRYKGRDVSPQQVGLELNVAAVLLGRLSLRDDQLEVGVEIVNVVDGTQMWGSHYWRRLADIIAIEEEIAADISENLRGRLSRHQRVRRDKRATTNSEAYQLYLRGRFFWNKRSPDGIRKAIEYFEQAIALDAHFALAHAGLADCYTVLGAGEYGLMAPQEALAKARVSATRAIDLDDRIPEAHTSLAFVRFAHDWNWDAAEREFLRALEINPSHAMTRAWYSILLTSVGRLDEGIAEAKHAVELDPLSALTRYYLAFALYLARRWNEAIDECNKGLELEPGYLRYYVLLSATYNEVHRSDEAVALIQKLIHAWERTPFLMSMLGATYARTGKSTEAQAIIDELHEQARARYVSPYEFARIYLSLRDFDRFFEWLERAYEERSGWLLQMKASPYLDPARADPRFDEMLRRIGFPP